MNTAVINVRTNAEVKRKAQKVAQDMGMSLSGLINGILKHVIKTQTVTFTAHEEPSDWLIKALKESKEDIKAGRIISFKTWEEEERYLNKLIADDKKPDRN